MPLDYVPELLLTGPGFLSAPERQAVRWIIERKVDDRLWHPQRPISVRRASARTFDLVLSPMWIGDKDPNTIIISGGNSWLVHECLSEFVKMGLLAKAPGSKELLHVGRNSTKWWAWHRCGSEMMEIP